MWDKRLLNDFGAEQETEMIQIEILDWIGFGKVEHGRRCNMLLDEDWLKFVEMGPSIGHML